MGHRCKKIFTKFDEGACVAAYIAWKTLGDEQTAFWILHEMNATEWELSEIPEINRGMVQAFQEREARLEALRSK